MGRMFGERTFPGRPGYVAGSETSEAAAESISDKTLGDLHRKVYGWIKRSGGCTDEEGEAALGMSGNTYRPRRRELELQGWVKKSGERATTESGRTADVWVITDKTKAVAS